MDEKPNQVKEMKNNIGNTTALVVSFDCTGSMSSCIQEVRQKLRDLAEMMFQDIKGLKIGLIAHGDYCDGDNCINILDLTDDVERIMNFINNTPNVGGGDAPECYEYVLHQAKSLSWPETGGAFVLIGDATPHEQNPNNLDWRVELKGLKEKNVNVFAMQCLKSNNAEQNKFWEEVSGEAGTPLLILEHFGESATTLGAVAYASSGDIGAYATYKSRHVAPTASLNLCSNVSKLESFVKFDTTTTETE